jgi:uncharacterized integral membrane protein
MIIFFILGLLLGGMAVVFALENVTIITVTFFQWQLTGSLALILMSAIAAGVFAALLLILPSSIANYFRYNSLANELEKLQEELRKQKTLTLFAKQNPPTPETIEQIEKGDIATKTEYASS